MGDAVSSATNAITDAARDTRNTAQKVYRNPYVRSAAATFLSPLLAQDIALSRVVGGGDARSVFRSPGEALSNPSDYAKKHQRELLATNAAIAGGAAGGAVGLSLAIPSAGFVAPGGVALSALGGTVLGAGGGALIGNYVDHLATPAPDEAPPGPGSPPPPEVVEPRQKRRRQIAGRAGTFLTGPSGIGSSPSTGTNLGGAGGRSTLLGL